MNRLRFSGLILLLCQLIALGKQDRVPSMGQETETPQPQTEQNRQPASSAAQSIIKQLEARRERTLNPPEGFEYFEGQGYRFLVPAPMELEGREGNVTRVSVMGTRMLVLAGDPEADSGAFDHCKSDSWHSPYCSGAKFKVGKHSGWIYELRRRNESGSSLLIFDKGRVIRIDCVNQEEDITSSGNDSYKERRLNMSRAQAQAADRQGTDAMCSQLFQSVELDEDTDDSLSQPSALYDPDKAARSAVVLQQTSPEPIPVGVTSLGDLSRNQRALPSAYAITFEATGDPDAAPAGFRWLGLSLACKPACNRSRVLIPEGAVAMPDYPEVFQMSLDKEVVSIFAGRPTTWADAPSLWHIPMFAVQPNTNPSLTTLYEEERVIHERRAKISRVRLVDAAGNVFLGEGAVFNITGDIGIGCLIPENKFGEFEPVCARMIDSLQVE
jgi:hypothetical protein